MDKETVSATRKAGTDSGKAFKASFESSSKGLGAGVLKTLTNEVAKSSRAVATARSKELDATGKVRVAESALADARSKYASNSTQVIRAEERLSAAQRQQVSAQDNLKSATEGLTGAKKRLADATQEAGRSGSRLGGIFGRLPSIFRSSGSSAATSFGASFKTNLGQIFTGNLLADLVQSGGRLIGQGLGAAVALGLSSVNLASELEQNLGAVDAVFKAQGAAIKEFSQTAAKDVGLSRSAYQKFAIVVGAQLKNLRVPFKLVAGQTNNLIELGADLAAQFGGSTADAVGAISSLLRGERDPIERYGVSLKQVDIEARKAQLGLKGLTGEAEKQADIQATLSLLTEQTAAAQGTFARETDTYAGKQARLNATLEDTKTRLGESLLPAFTRLAEFGNTTVAPALDRIIDKVGPKFGAALDKAAPRIEQLVDKVIPLAEQFGELVAEDGIPGFISLMDDIAEQAPEWIDAFKDIDNFFYGLTDFINDNEVKDFFKPFRDGLQETFSGIGSDSIVDASYNQYLKAGKKGAEGFATGLGSNPGAGKEALKNVLGTALSEVESNPALGQAGSKASDQFAQGLTAGSGKVKTSATSTFSILPKTAADASFPLLRNSGVNAAAGFAAGINSPEAKEKVRKAAKVLADVASIALDVALDINSPSKRWMQSGLYSGEGYALGLDKSHALVASSASALAAIPTTMSSSSSSSGSTGGGGYGNVYIDKIVAPDENPVVSGRVMAREFLRVKAG